MTVAVIDSGLWAHPALRSDDRRKREGARPVRRHLRPRSMRPAVRAPTPTATATAPWSTSAHRQLRPRGRRRYLGDRTRRRVWCRSRPSTTTDGDLPRCHPRDRLGRCRTRTPTASGSSTARSRPAGHSHYWEDPLNQAVMAAWQAGIVVVASAGNTGPDPMTIGVPGNVPYIITVGAHDATTTRPTTPMTTIWPRSPRPARPTRASSSRTSSPRAATSPR